MYVSPTDEESDIFDPLMSSKPICDSPNTGIRDTGSNSENSRGVAFIDPGKKQGSGASGSGCDQCQLRNSECERNSIPSEPCLGCSALGTECTFLGHRFERGPPKENIDDLERRVRQVESILDTILKSQDPKAQEPIGDLQKDDLARDNGKRVERGPSSPSKGSDEHASSQEAVMASIMQPFKSRPGTDESERSIRSGDSRVARENVLSSGNLDDMQSATLERRDSLIASLGTLDSQNTGLGMPSTAGGQESFYDEGDNATTDGKKADDAHNQRPFRRGESNGLSSQSKGSKRSLADERSSSGLWRFPLSAFARMKSADLPEDIEDGLSGELPPLQDQDLLVELYFTYVHPVLPVVHKASFMESFRSRKHTSAKPTKTLPSLLLLSMFAVAGRYKETDSSDPNAGDELTNEIRQEGSEYFITQAARESLDSVFRTPSIATVQSMVLLSYRQFGLGSLEKAWIYCGIAIRVAQSLGLHRAADEWDRFGTDIFTPIEKEERILVWWACAIVEKHISCSLGRPVTISERNFDTELPDQNNGVTFVEEEEEIWEPHVSHKGVNIGPQKAHTISCLRAAAALSVIEGSIVDDVYSLRPESRRKQLTKFKDLEMRLDRWYNDLPVHLQLDVTRASGTGTPNILILNFRYWTTVILLHRKFIPEWQHGNKNSQPGESYTSPTSFDLCQTAATNINTLSTRFKEFYTLSTSCAFAPSYLLTAGLFHIATLTSKPNANAVAVSSGLRQIMTALEDMEAVWPSAFHNRQLLNGAKIKSDGDTASVPRSSQANGQVNRGNAGTRAPRSFDAYDFQSFSNPR